MKALWRSYGSCNFNTIMIGKGLKIGKDNQDGLPAALYPELVLGGEPIVCLVVI